jgi:succinyl-diaminopimelate desuccinylase
LNAEAGVLRALSSYREEMVDFACRLIAVPTENPPGREYDACVEVIAGELRRIGLPCELLAIPPSPPATPRSGRRAAASPSAAGGRAPLRCVRSFHGAGPRTLYFHGHYDVVPAPDPRQFLPLRQGDLLSGRGSADMKGGLAAMTYAVRAIKDSGVALDGRLGLLMVPDEETGGAVGSGALAAAGLLGKHGIGMLTPEPSGGVVWNGNRGAVTLRVTVRGRPSHVGLHFKGVNSFEGMVALADRLLELEREIERRETAFHISPAAARRSVLLLGGECSGGTGFNVVPQTTSFTIDRRTNPEEDLGEEKRRLLELLTAPPHPAHPEHAPHPAQVHKPGPAPAPRPAPQPHSPPAGRRRAPQRGTAVEVEVLQEGSASGVSEDHPLARALARRVAEVTGKPPRFELCPGLLENRFYAERGVPALAYGPGRLSVSHGPHELVEIGRIADCAAIYALTALDLLGVT